MRTPRHVRAQRIVPRSDCHRRPAASRIAVRSDFTSRNSVRTLLDCCRQSRVAWWLLAGIAWCLLAGLASAQLPQTRLYALFPTGGQVGKTFDVTVTRGEDLDELDRLLFSHPGITATAKMTAPATGKPELIPNQFTVTIAPDVPAGQYEVRAAGLFGISNPRIFSVGTRGELAEVEPNNTREQAKPIELEQTVNGRINGATDVDFFKFAGQAGQRILVDCAAQRIDSRLNATLELHDASGRRLAAAHNNVAKDAVLDYTLTAPGEYFVRLTDFVYAGSEDHFYRLTLRNSAFVDFVVPPAGVPGTTAQYTLYGRNLPQGQPSEIKVDGRPLDQQVVEITLPAEATSPPKGIGLEPYAAGVDGFAYTLQTPAGPANTVMIGYAASPVISEQEPNNEPANAQKITMPVELAGAFQQRGDVDLYDVEAQAGDVYWIEVQGQRLGSGCDPYLTVDQVTKNAEGAETLKRIAAVDDDASNPLPIIFDTLNDDPAYKFAAPAAGTYRLTLRDRYGASRGSPALQYRLTIRKEQPDFRLVIVTDSPQPAGQKIPQSWSIGLRRGDQFPVYAIVLRQDGFEGDVEVSAEGLPPGVTCRSVSIGSKPSQGVLVFESAEDAAAWAGTVKVVGKAKLTDAAAEKAVVQAKAALKPAQDAIAAAMKALEKPAADFQQAEQSVAKAKEELAAKADDAGLQKKVTDAEAVLTAAKPAYDAAMSAVTAAQQKLAETNQQIATAVAARDAAVKELVRGARYGTIAWNGAANTPGKARLADGLQLSVMNELAPFQVQTTVDRVVAHHNRQILIPVTAIRRDAFDADIALTFVGQPANVQIENKPIKKGTTEELLRVFVPPNAPAGTYVLHLAAQAQVAYRRNPQKEEELKVALTEADNAAKAAVEEQKVAVAKRDEATKSVATKQAELKQAVDAKAAAEKTLADAKAAEKTAVDAVTAAGEDASAKAEAEKKLTEAQAAVKTAEDALAKAEAARVAAETQAKQAEDTKVAAEAAIKPADDKVKATAAEKTAAEKRHTDAANAAKPKNINFLPTTEPIVLTIKPAPYTLTATPAEGGKLVRGGKVDVKVAIKRQNEFAGPVTLTLAVPPNFTGIAAEPVTIPADQSEGTLSITATAEATEGAVTHLVVRAVSDFDGEALVDQPVTITVSK